MNDFLKECTLRKHTKGHSLLSSTKLRRRTLKQTDENPNKSKTLPARHTQMRNKTERTTATVQIQELQPAKAGQNTDLANHKDAAMKPRRKGQKKKPDDLPDRRSERGRTPG